MRLQELNWLHIIHVFAAIGLVGSVFYACAGAPETRKKIMIWGGIASLVMLVTGVRMWQGLYQFHGGWVWVKLFCWFALSGLGGMAYRRREKAGLWLKLALLFAFVALVMVYTQPF